jgi:hypothetical protein
LISLGALNGSDILMSLAFSAGHATSRHASSVHAVTTVTAETNGHDRLALLRVGNPPKLQVSAKLSRAIQNPCHLLNGWPLSAPCAETECESFKSHPLIYFPVSHL